MTTHANVLTRPRIIRGGRIVDHRSSRAEARDLLIVGAHIAEIGAPGMDAPADAQVVDASDCLLIPGLINSHSHSHGGLAKSLGDLWTLELLQNYGAWTTANRSHEDTYLSAKLAAVEMLLRGCTSCYDLVYEFPVPSVEGMEAVAQAYLEVGIRAVLAPLMADHTLYQAVPGLLDAMPESQRRDMEKLRRAGREPNMTAARGVLANWRHDRNRVGLALAPTVPLQCSEGFLRDCGHLASEFGVGIHSHLDETRMQSVAGYRRYGKSVTAWLDELGLIGAGFTVGHGVWLSRDDMRILAGRGASVAHCPGSNMRLGSGLAAVRSMLESGLNVGLGTDCGVCADNSNMFEAMRLAAYVSRVQDRDYPEWLSTPEALRLATEGSARALGLDAVTGRLSAGYLADIVFLSLNDITLMPLNNPVNQVVFSVDGSAVEHVMVGGKLVVRDGRCVTVDLARLRADAQRASDRLLAANAEIKEKSDQLADVVGQFCSGLARQHPSWPQSYPAGHHHPDATH